MNLLTIIQFQQFAHWSSIYTHILSQPMLVSMYPQAAHPPLPAWLQFQSLLIFIGSKFM